MISEFCWEQACPSAPETCLSLWELSRVPTAQDGLNTAASAREEPSPRRGPHTASLARSTGNKQLDGGNQRSPLLGPLTSCPVSFSLCITRLRRESHAHCLDALPLHAGPLAVWPGPSWKTLSFQMPVAVGSWDRTSSSPCAPPGAALPPPLPCLALWLLRGPPHTYYVPAAEHPACGQTLNRSHEETPRLDSSCPTLVNGPASVLAPFV